ncbi:MAG TPA: hypothetical protein VKY27_01750 [Bacteriovoracaceae bacterium]|nr:hypothetical protein [Bacteriovoracaceae bacterium]
MAKTLALFFVLGMFVSCAHQERKISSTPSEAPVKEYPIHYQFTR